MFANFSKAIANRVVHGGRSAGRLRGGFVRTSPLDFPRREDSIALNIMGNYRAHRLAEIYEYGASQMDSAKPNSKFGGLIKEKSEALKTAHDNTTSLIQHYQIAVETLPLEAVANLLYLIARLNTANERLETALLRRLAEKSAEDATETNLADLLFYFKAKPAQAGAHKELLSALVSRAKRVQQDGLTPLGLNGSTVGLYEAKPSGGYSALETGIFAFLESKGAEDAKLFFKYKYVLPAFNAIFTATWLKQESEAWLAELSPFNELQRLSAHLEGFK